MEFVAFKEMCKRHHSIRFFHENSTLHFYFCYLVSCCKIPDIPFSVVEFSIIRYSVYFYLLAYVLIGY